MPLFRAVAMPLAALMLALVTLTTDVALAQQTADAVGDPKRGKTVFRTIGFCVNCHGWAADGKTGVNLRSPTGANLRLSTLDTAALMETIKCGRPGTAMPYHDRAAYKDDRCYGMVLSDFAAGEAPTRGKPINDKDIANLVAYLQTHVIGRKAPTFAECTDFFDNPSAQACDSLK